MLREDLQDEHIPHRMTVRNQILQVWDEHLVTLSTEMKVCVLYYVIRGLSNVTVGFARKDIIYV